MKIKDQTRKLATGCSKHCFEVVNKTDEVSSKHGFEIVMRLTKSAQNTVLRCRITDEVMYHTYGKATCGLKRFSKSIRKNQSPKGVDYEVIVYRNF
ncbi:chlorohydrolase [Streptococcus pneumoniae]|nr:chlorohydrolase [Streptococcus pneumoniae]